MAASAAGEHAQAAPSRTDAGQPVGLTSQSAPVLGFASQVSRFSTFSAFCWMNSRRGSTTSPISLVKMSSASARSSTLTCKQRARLGVQRGFPQLVGVHLAQTLVALQGQALLALGQDRLSSRSIGPWIGCSRSLRTSRAGGRRFPQDCRSCRGQRRRASPERSTAPSSVRSSSTPRRMRRQADAVVLCDAALPAPFVFDRDQVQTLGHTVSATSCRSASTRPGIKAPASAACSRIWRG